MKIITTNFEGLLIIEQNKLHDKRGHFSETFRCNLINKNLNYEFKICQINSVKSYKYSLRGLHFQKEPFSQSKFIQIISGEILDIAVDLRKKSKTYGNYFKTNLSEDMRSSVFIPKGFAHGYLTLSKEAILNYAVDNYYNKESESGIRYDDKHLNIDWGIDSKLINISEKDKYLKDFNWE